MNQSPSKLPKNSLLHNKKSLCYAAMLTPFLIFFIVFLVLPIICSVILSFCDFDLIRFPKWIGFENYIRMLIKDETFLIIVKNTLKFAVITGPAGFFLSFILAWFINNFPPFLRTVFSFMFYCPALVGSGYFIWQIAFSSDSYGYINSILLSANIIKEPIIWFEN